MTEYVAGFMFSGTGDKVALVRKARPKWQAGRLNAIGGHIEEGETPRQAMVREFEEETGRKTDRTNWIPLCVLSGRDFTVHFFYTMGWPLDDLKTLTDEEIVVVNTKDVTPYNAIPNLQWLIPMAKNMRYDSALRFDIQEVYV